MTENERYQIYVMKKAVNHVFDMARLVNIDLHKQSTSHYFQVLYTLNKRIKL